MKAACQWEEHLQGPAQGMGRNFSRRGLAAVEGCSEACFHCEARVVSVSAGEV